MHRFLTFLFLAIIIGSSVNSNKDLVTAELDRFSTQAYDFLTSV